MARKREFNVFSLSFLDIMSCGFGAVILIYIVIHHSTELTSRELNVELMAEVKKLEAEVTTDTENLAQLKNVLNQTEDRIVTTEGMALEITRSIRQLKSQISELDGSGSSQKDSIEKLKSDLKQLEEEAANLQGSVAAAETSGRSLRSIAGEGDRQYLTGLRIGGNRILILLDASASMLDKTIVNVIRLRNMSDAKKRQSEKWQRATRIFEWIMANIPKTSKFQAYTFNTQATSLQPTKPDTWLDAIDKKSTDQVVKSLAALVPGKGTSLHAAFSIAGKLEPRPDNIILISDGLPTQGSGASRSTIVSSKERLEHFQDSLTNLPGEIPVNVILLPMEGDPMASPSYWRLAQMTGGSFLSPSEDWP